MDFSPTCHQIHHSLWCVWVRVCRACTMVDRYTNTPRGSIWSDIHQNVGFPGGPTGKESACNVGNPDWIPGSGRAPAEGNGNPLQYSCMEKSHGQRSLMGNSSWVHRGLDMTECLSLTHSPKCNCSAFWVGITVDFHFVFVPFRFFFFPTMNLNYLFDESKIITTATKKLRKQVKHLFFWEKD